VKKNITQLGQKEAEFLSHVSSNGGQFAMEEAMEFWVSREMARKKLHQLEKRGWISRIEKGKYLVIPLEAGADRIWSEEPFLIASALVQPSAIAYWSAVRHWNWTEQIPRILYVQTTSRKNQKQKVVFGVTYQFVAVSPAKYFGHTTEWYKGKPVLITDREKTLIDCADDVERSGAIEELVKAVKAGVSEISWIRLNEYIFRFPNGAVPKRLGYLFETLIPDLSTEAKEFLSSWQTKLSAGVINLQPAATKSGKISTRWRVRVNAGIG
jgi:predicted transcriptional regulator of viral defense system